jgi:hypothetical protein
MTQISGGMNCRSSVLETSATPIVVRMGIIETRDVAKRASEKEISHGSVSWQTPLKDFRYANCGLFLHDIGSELA